MKDNISPEEKLLRLIRKEKKQDLGLDKKISGATTDFKPKIRYHLHPIIQKYSSFLDIHKIVLIVLGASCFYLTVSLIYSRVGFRTIKLPTVTQEKITMIEKEPKVEIKPYEFYLEGIKNRQIFGNSSTTQTEQPISTVNLDIMKNINLVGIISGESPQAIVEDKRTQKTYYVTKGQLIAEFQVEDIQEGKIIINYKGQRFELYL